MCTCCTMNCCAAITAKLRPQSGRAEWKIEMIAEISDVKPSAASVEESESEEIVPVGPKQHAVFQSSSENSYKLTGTCH